MNALHKLALCAAVGLVSGCANPDSVLFVTDSSIGINVDSKPPTASIAYDRIEGYIGPRYQNGALPPVVASLETGGNVFNPKIRQVYATGAAAVKAVGTPNAADGPGVLSGDPAQKRLVFFGTTTTLGLKVGFSTGGTPDSLVFGYNRKEISFIPLGSQTTNGVTTDVYPSVLASIDTTTTTTSLQDTGLTSKQFVATGQAAETLAQNPSVTSAFNTISQDAVTAALTPEQKQTALAAGNVQSQVQDTRLTRIMNSVAPNGTLDQTKLANLVDAANSKAPGSVNTDLKKVTDAASLKARIVNDQPTVTSLFNALNAIPASK